MHRLLLLLALLAPITAADNLALLSGTLRTFQVAGCEGQVEGLSCPPGTCISVQYARYGAADAAAASLCPLPANDPPQSLGTQPGCEIPSAMQYSLLLAVVEACQKKRQCKFQSTPKPAGADPCPGVTRYVEITYKCRPYEFRSKMACENEVVQLKCNPNSRVAVYSAKYGRTEYESVQCPQPQGVPEETCLVSYATETVMHICHGKRQCTLSADAATFGSPCRKESRMYLKVVYTCVPRKVLRENYEERPEADESLEPEPADFEAYDGVDDTVYGDMFSPSPNLGRNNSSGQLASHRPPPPTPPAGHHAPSPDSDNKERVLLYVIISVGLGVLCLLTLVVLRLLWLRHKTSKRSNKFDTAGSITLGTTSLSPDGFMDTISEVDADIDLTTINSPVTVVHTPPSQPKNSQTSVVRYGGGKSASSGQPSHYYYG